MKNIVRDLLGRHKHRADYLEVRMEENQMLRLQTDKTGLQEVLRRNASRGCVRAWIQGGWGFSSFESLDDLDCHVERALAWAKQGRGRRSILAPVPVVEEDHRVVTSSHPDDVPLQKKLDYLLGWRSQALGFGKQVVDVLAYYYDLARTVVFGNSEGTLIRQDLLDSAATLVVIAKKGEVIVRNHLSDGSSNTFNYMKRLDQKVRNHIATTNDLAEADSVKSRHRDVVLNPDMTGLFTHEAFGHTMEADHFAEKPDQAKVLRIGRQLAKPIVSIHDSGGHPGNRGYVVFDDEGVRTRETMLLDRGVLCSHLHSRETAGLLNEEPTGNARAINCQFPPIVRMRTTALAPGTSSLNDLIADIDDGIYVVDSAGGSTDGEKFQFFARYGRRIRKGRLGELVRNISLLGNLFETLGAIDGVGDDFFTPDSMGGCGKNGQAPLPISFGGPHIRIRHCLVGGDR